MTVSEIPLYINGCQPGNLSRDRLAKIAGDAYLRSVRAIAPQNENVKKGLEACIDAYVGATLEGIELVKTYFNSFGEYSNEYVGRFSKMVYSMTDYILQDPGAESKHTAARNDFAEFLIWEMVSTAVTPVFRALPASPGMDASVGKQSKGGDIIVYDTYGDPSLAFLIDVYAPHDMRGNPNIDRELERKRARFPVNKMYGLPCVVFSVGEMSRMMGMPDFIQNAKNVIRANGSLAEWAKPHRSAVRSYLADQIDTVSGVLHDAQWVEGMDSTCAACVWKNMAGILEAL